VLLIADLVLEFAMFAAGCIQALTAPTARAAQKDRNNLCFILLFTSIKIKNFVLIYFAGGVDSDLNRVYFFAGFPAGFK
jgi:hypothetical protein